MVKAYCRQAAARLYLSTTSTSKYPNELLHEITKATIFISAIQV
jgi:hypothetical protein